MFRRIVLSACIGGLLAGLVLTGLQMLQVVPIILEAETFEGSGMAADGHGHAHGTQAGEAEHAPGLLDRIRAGVASFHATEAEWAPRDGLQRTLYSALANIVIGIGFGLLLGAAYSLRKRIDPAQGVLWGLAGFAVFFVLPSIGLHPEIPGDMAAPLVDRQAWWLLTVVCSASGLALVFLRQEWSWKIGGLVLLLVPHVIGAPHPEMVGGTAPRELASSFVWATALVNGVFWVVLGWLTALSFRKLR